MTEGSYKRIGPHRDWQFSPHLEIWPTTAVALRLDEISPANGFLPAVPGSRQWSRPFRTAPHRTATYALTDPTTKEYL